MEMKLNASAYFFDAQRYRLRSVAEIGLNSRDLLANRNCCQECQLRFELGETAIKNGRPFYLAAIV